MVLTADLFGDSSQRVWFITGASKGFGLTIAKVALQRNDLVIATARHLAGAEELNALSLEYQASCKLLQLDITADFATIQRCAEEAQSFWGRVDVLVNNAGYGIIGSMEEAGPEQYHELYKTNVYGHISVTNAFLPHMRARRSGTVVFIGSRSGWKTAMILIGLYASSKAALHAVADSLSAELKPFNIRVLNVVPGGLRTPNIESARVVQGSTKLTFREAKEASEEKTPEDSVSKAQVDTTISPYSGFWSHAVNAMTKTHGAQPGDPYRAADVVIDVVKGEGIMVTEDGKLRSWPGTLFLGSDCIEDVRARCEEVLKLLDEWSDVAKSIDY